MKIYVTELKPQYVTSQSLNDNETALYSTGETAIKATIICGKTETLPIMEIQAQINVRAEIKDVEAAEILIKQLLK